MENQCLPEERRCTTLGERFGGFAAGHLSFSVLLTFVCGPIAMSFPVGEMWLYMAPLLFMGLYFPIGMLVSWLNQWTLPQTDREKILAVFQPTMVAWAWVGVVFFSIAAEAGELFVAVFAASFILAAPSSVVAILSAGAFQSWSGLLIGGITAGFLPPLLFALGSFWQSARMEQRGRAL